MKKLSMLLLGLACICMADVALGLERGEPNSGGRAFYCAAKLRICLMDFPDSHCAGVALKDVESCRIAAKQHCQNTFGPKSNCKSKAIM